MKRFNFVLLLMIFCQLSRVNLVFSDTNAAKYKTLLSEAKNAVKNGKDQAKAERNLLAVYNREDITRKQHAEIYFMAQELQRSINESENMKLYLHQPYDTTKFFSTILKMHEYLLACDSVEAIPDEKGKVSFKYRKRSQGILTTYRSNLLNGGMFLLKRRKYAEAFPYFDTFIVSACSPLLRGDTLVTQDAQLSRVAYWATVSGYNDNHPKHALKHIDLAIEGASDSLRISLMEYKVRCYEQLGDEENWIKNLIEGNCLYPSHDYFYLHLMDVYMQNRMYEEGIELCDSMLSQVGDRAIYWYGASQMHLARKDYEATIRTADEAIRCDSTMGYAYYNKGMAYLNKAVIFAETACNDIRDPKCKKDRATLMELYRSAQKPMEQVRCLCPQDDERWASPLYRIYLNLNMGKEFAEMENILNAR